MLWDNNFVMGIIMNACVRVFASVTISFFLTLQSLFSYTNSIGNINSGSGVMSNASKSSVGNIGLFQSGAQSNSNTNWARAGMLVSFLMNPNLDFDGDGIPDEDDRDDDGDAIADSSELYGDSFVPAMATDPFDSDSDDDGATDGDEAVAGTNPQDASSLFRITEIRKEGSSIVVVWKGRDGVSYDLAAAASLTSGVFTVVSSNIVATGGTGVWYEAEVSATNVPASWQLFYRININQ